MDSDVPAIVEKDSRQMELFVKDTSSEPMNITEFTQWLSDNYGFGIAKVLQIAAFMLCCDVISQDIAKSTLRLRELLDNGTSRIVHPQKHEVAALLAMEPNTRHTWYEFTEMMVYWGCLTSNSYAVIFRNNVGDPVELIPMQTGRVVDMIEGRNVVYYVTAGTMQEQALLGTGFMAVPERNMIHVRGRMLDGLRGYSTIVAGHKTLDTTSAMEDFRNKLFGEEGQIRGVFSRTADGPLDEQAFQRLRQQFKVLMNKFRQLTEPVILEDGLKFETISSNPQEMELSKQFEAQINEVCRLLRVPPHKVFLLGADKYNNLETAEKQYVGDTLIPIAKRFEQRYSKMLLSQKDRLRYFFEYDRNDMTLRDPKNETDRVIRAAERGIILTDEARAALGYNPLDNGAGQTRTVPVNFVVLDDNNEIIVGASGTDGLAPEQSQDDQEQPNQNSDAKKKDDSAKIVRLIASK